MPTSTMTMIVTIEGEYEPDPLEVQDTINICLIEADTQNWGFSLNVEAVDRYDLP